MALKAGGGTSYCKFCALELWSWSSELTPRRDTGVTWTGKKPAKAWADLCSSGDGAKDAEGNTFFTTSNKSAGWAKCTGSDQNGDSVQYAADVSKGVNED